MVDFESIDTRMNGQIHNVSGTITQISNLMSNTCYIFAVRAYTINGYSEWVYTTNKTLPVKSGESINFTYKNYYMIGSSATVIGGIVGSVVIILIIIIIVIIVIVIMVSR